MAIARTFECKGWTPEQYDALMERLGYGPGKAGPGVLFHWAAETPDGMLAVDVYESREAAEALVERELGAVMQELGLSMPEIAEYEVRNFAR